MRAETLRKVEALHRKITALVEAEKAHWRSRNPGCGSLLAQIAETKIEVAAWSPAMKLNSFYATASVPRLGAETPPTSEDPTNV